MENIYVLLNEENFFLKEVEASTPNAVEAPYYYGLASQHKLVNNEWLFDENIITSSDIPETQSVINRTIWRPVRKLRDEKLASCDWTQLPDVPLTTKEAWAVYRQALRDITQQPDPFNIVWPEPPQ